MWPSGRGREREAVAVGVVGGAVVGDPCGEVGGEGEGAAGGGCLEFVDDLDAAADASEAVADVDDAATSFPELNFVVEHVGLPRLDDFCWIAAQEPNVYGGLAVAAPMAVHRPRKFGEIMGELLFWLGEDRILFGSDYALWNPDWLVDQVMNAELTDEQKDEYGVELDVETMKKIMGENVAGLYDIDIEEKKRQFRDDDISEKFDLGAHYGGDAGAAAD